MKRGRPASIDSKELYSILLEYKDQIFNEKNWTVLSKHDPLWLNISARVLEVTGVLKSVFALHTHVTCRKIFSKTKFNETVDNEHNLDSSAESEINDSAFRNGDVIEIHFSKSEFNNILEDKFYKQNKKTKRAKTRIYKIFTPGKWQLEMTIKLWDERRIGCGFLYERGRVYENSAAIKGHCKCGSRIDCVISDLKREVIVVTCTLQTSSHGTCSKRPCRNPERGDIGRRLMETGKSASVAQKETANNLMLFGDDIPPHLYDAQTFRDAKCEYVRGTHVHKIPLTALCILKSNALKNAIHFIGAHPFFAWYGSVQQLHVYNAYSRANRDDAKISIDATGKLVRKILRPDGTMSGHIFLYECVINWENQQFPVYQMLSEKHDALHIANWLRQWKKMGASAPKELDSDDGKALVIAAINAFTKHQTITEYANACFLKKKIPCYIRIDVAHFIHNYAILLKDVQPLVKRFFMVAVGQLILSRSDVEADRILRSIFIICQSTSSGSINDSVTECSRSIEFIKDMVICSRHENMETEIGKAIDSATEPSRARPDDIADPDSALERNELNDVEGHDESGPLNLYFTWAQNIDNEVSDIIKKETGDEPNAYFFPSLAKKLLNDSKEIPMWSCIMRDHFGYGRVPASSATVESDFNNLKTRLLNKKVGLRVDDFVKLHLDDISGASNMIIGGQNDAETSAHSIDIQIERSVSGEKFSAEPVIHSNKCAACKNGDFPTGAHKCAMCTKSVHIFERCSIACPGEEEGYGQRRICHNCSARETEAIEEVLSSRETEKWKGYDNESVGKNDGTKKKSYYMRNNFLESDFANNGKKHERSILKNANSLELKANIIEGVKYSVQNTCAFDSITQLFLKIIRPPILRDSVILWNTEFAEFVVKLFDSGIVSNTYAKRASILLKVTPKTNFITRPGLTILRCETSAAELSAALFKEHPFASEVALCNGCDRKLVIPMTSIAVEISDVCHLTDALENICRPKMRACSDKCNGQQTSNIEFTGPFLILDVYTATSKLKRIKLANIPKEVTVTTLGATFELEGFISFIPPAPKTRKSVRFSTESQENEEEDLLALSPDIAHYTAALLQENGQWTEIDDLLISEKPLKNKSVVPHLLIYTKASLSK